MSELWLRVFEAGIKSSLTSGNPWNADRVVEVATRLADLASEEAAKKAEPSFAKGQRVKHVDRGDGTIVSVHYLMGERSYWFAPDGKAAEAFETSGKYLKPIPAEP